MAPYVTEILDIPDVNGDFPLKVTADHGAVLVESKGTFLDPIGLDILYAALKTAALVAARQRAEMGSVSDADA